MTINSDVAVLQMRIGYENVVTNPDYDNSGVVDAADYVLWRKGGPISRTISRLLTSGPTITPIGDCGLGALP